MAPDFDAITRSTNAVIVDVVREQKVSVKEGLGTLTREYEQIAREASYTGTTRS